MSERASVPCNGCTACCRNDAIVLHPELGDRPEDYRTYQGTHPLTGKPCHFLERRASDNSCVYLGASGCTIHERAPAICREFDCRRQFLMHSRPERRALVAIGAFSKAVWDAGRARLHTLAGE